MLDALLKLVIGLKVMPDVNNVVPKFILDQVSETIGSNSYACKLHSIKSTQYRFIT